jgi:hypothetical protein
MILSPCKFSHKEKFSSGIYRIRPDNPGEKHDSCDLLYQFLASWEYFFHDGEEEGGRDYYDQRKRS